jgi:hypothetical protein
MLRNSVRRPMSLTDARRHREPIWPLGIIVFGLGLTMSWTVLLVYGLVRIVEYAI